MIDSDHAPHTHEDLARYTADPWTGPFGSPQYEYMLSLALTDVHDGRFTLRRMIELMSENAARLIGQYPKKGAIQVGSDADIVLVDLDKEVVPPTRRRTARSVGPRTWIGSSPAAPFSPCCEEQSSPRTAR